MAELISILPPWYPRVGFTHTFDSLASSLESALGVSEPYHPSSPGPKPEVHEVTAIWDTGASHSAISSRLVSRLNLQKIDERTVHSVRGTHISSVYLVNVYLTSEYIFMSELSVTEADLGEEDILVGMDIISRGDFAVTNDNGKTCLSFQVPSQGKIDLLTDLKGNIGSMKSFTPVLLITSIATGPTAMDGSTPRIVWFSSAFLKGEPPAAWSIEVYTHHLTPIGEVIHRAYARVAEDERFSAEVQRLAAEGRDAYTGVKR